MDDDLTIRRTVKLLLQRLGYQVAVAENGPEAIELYQEAQIQGQPFELVLLDLTIPGNLGGKQTLAELLKLDPQVKAVVCSGYSSDPLMENYGDYGFVGALLKPYRLEELRAILDKFLSQP